MGTAAAEVDLRIEVIPKVTSMIQRSMELMTRKASGWIQKNKAARRLEYSWIEKERVIELVLWDKADRRGKRPLTLKWVDKVTEMPGGSAGVRSRLVVREIKAAKPHAEQLDPATIFSSMPPCRGGKVPFGPMGQPASWTPRTTLAACSVGRFPGSPVPVHLSGLPAKKKTNRNFYRDEGYYRKKKIATTNGTPVGAPGISIRGNPGPSGDRRGYIG